MKRGILRSSRSLESVDDVFGMMKRSIEKKSVRSLLKGSVAYEGFRRLT